MLQTGSAVVENFVLKTVCYREERLILKALCYRQEGLMLKTFLYKGRADFENFLSYRQKG